MATRLKNMTNRGKASLALYLASAAGIAVCSGVYVSSRWFGGWNVNQQFKILCYLFVSLFIIAVSVFFHFYPARAWKDMKRWKIDTIGTEVLAAGLLLDLWVWFMGIHSSIMDGTLFYCIRIVSYGMILVTCVLFYFPVALIGTGCIVLLGRRVLQGTLKKSSVIYDTVQKRRFSMAFEKAMRENSRASFIIATVCLAGTVGAVWKSGLQWGDPFGVVVIAVLAVVSYVCYIKSFRNNKVYKDTACLLRQIDEMSDGELNAQAIEEEDSLLYEGSKKLSSIGANLKRIMEKQMQAERMKIDLITNVSHDLKTPLTSMVGYIDLLKKEEMGDEAKDYVDVLALKQEQLKDMIQDIFDLSKSTSGEVNLELEELDMKKLLEQTLGDMEDAVVKSGMAIRERVDDRSLNIVGDGKKLYRVLQNIISNALKYSLKGTRIYIDAGREENQVYVSVKNTASYEMDFGPEEIMERFSRGDKSRNTEGHGLGLAIAESFTKNMGGSMSVDIDGDQFKVKVVFEGLQA
ncbi:hypothetical protein CE91St62_38230 [Lachnospiraceae bacterium]|nr:hypothetical protein CE91St61_38350 [Lachnospiraceae bacterium]BDF39762.1 hypothetical protein CE91St62_38230 [Lachnospiraceae bacterium]